jgi:hypothetical protein
MKLITILYNVKQWCLTIINNLLILTYMMTNPRTVGLPLTRISLLEDL